jgi:hypothetical protein
LKRQEEFCKRLRLRAERFSQPIEEAVEFTTPRAGAAAIAGGIAGDAFSAAARWK